MGVYFDAFKDKKSNVDSPHKARRSKMPRGSLLDSANVGPSSSAAQDWDLFGKHLSEQEKENFDIPDRASAFYVNIKRSLLSNLLG